MSIFSEISGWFMKVYKGVRTDGVKISIAVTEGIKTALTTGALNFVVQSIPGHSNIPKDILKLLDQWIPVILAEELAVEGLPDNPTEHDIFSFETRVITAFVKIRNRSKFYTVLSARIYGVIHSRVETTTHLTFAELVSEVEEAWQDYQKDLADEESSA